MRSSNGTGSIIKMGGKRRKPYAAVITTGWIQMFDDNGVPIGNPKQKRKYIGYGATRKEAMKILADYDGQSTIYDENGSKTAQKRPYVPSLKQMWNQAVLTHPTWAKTTLNNYRNSFNRLENLHNRRIDDITYKDLQMCMNVYMAEGHTKGSAKTHKAFMTMIFTEAIKSGYITSSPAQFVSYEGTADTIKKHALAPETIRQIVNSDTRTRNEVLILLYTGMRIGELFKLKPSDLHEHYLIGGSKTDAGKQRIIPIHPYINDLIRSWIQSEHVSYTRFTELLKEDCSTYGDKFSPHECRHTFITMAERYGINEKVAKRIVGHSSKDVTDSIYTHFTPDDLYDEICKIPAPEFL